MQIKVLEPVVADEIPVAEPVDQDTDDDTVNTGELVGFATQTIYQNKRRAEASDEEERERGRAYAAACQSGAARLRAAATVPTAMPTTLTLFQAPAVILHAVQQPFAWECEEGVQVH